MKKLLIVSFLFIPSVANAGFFDAFKPHYCQTVVASYYNEGKRTANGERFNRHGLTTAHRTLPFGTRLKITNPKTGRSVHVRVNDRGPFVRGRTLDLAEGAAFSIGMRATQKVCMEKE